MNFEYEIRKLKNELIKYGLYDYGREYVVTEYESKGRVFTCISNPDKIRIDYVRKRLKLIEKIFGHVPWE